MPLSCAAGAPKVAARRLCGIQRIERSGCLGLNHENYTRRLYMYPVSGHSNAAAAAKNRSNTLAGARRQVTSAGISRLLSGPSFHTKGPPMLKPTPIASNRCIAGGVIEVSTEVLRYANGRDHELDFVRHPRRGGRGRGGRSGSSLLRPPVSPRHRGLPVGNPRRQLDSGEAPAVCAVRELAGRGKRVLTARNWTAMGVYLPAPAYSPK